MSSTSAVGQYMVSHVGTVLYCQLRLVVVVMSLNCWWISCCISVVFKRMLENHNTQEDEDKKRWFKWRNHTPLQIDYTAVHSSTSASSKEEVSMMYGGKWDPVLHPYLCQPPTGDNLGYMEGGYLGWCRCTTIDQSSSGYIYIIGTTALISHSTTLIPTRFPKWYSRQAATMPANISISWDWIIYVVSRWNMMPSCARLCKRNVRGCGRRCQRDNHSWGRIHFA